jgi:hypothetical protein
MRLLILAFGLLAALPASAQAGGFVLPDIPEDLERWTLASESDSSITYVDLDTIGREGQSVTLWMWHALRTPSPAGGGLPEMDRSVSWVRYDCQQRTTQILYIVDYRRGADVRTMDMREQGDVRTWAPGSSGETMGIQACT